MDVVELLESAEELQMPAWVSRYCELLHRDEREEEMVDSRCPEDPVTLPLHTKLRESDGAAVTEKVGLRGDLVSGRQSCFRVDGGNYFQLHILEVEILSCGALLRLLSAP